MRRKKKCPTRWWQLWRWHERGEAWSDIDAYGFICARCNRKVFEGMHWWDYSGY